MKLNKWLITLILSVSLMLGNTTALVANTTTNDNNTQNTTQHVLDAIPSPDTTGSISFSEYINININLIKSVNLNQDSYTIPYLLPEVLNQGSYPGCVSFALRGILDILVLNSDSPDIDFSNGFIYGKRYGNYFGDGMISNFALNGLKEFGDCSFESFSDNGNYEYLHSKITQSMIDEAKNYRIQNFIKLNSDDEIKTALQTISPIYVTFPVYSSYMNPVNNHDGIIPNPNINSEFYYGSHAGILVAYKYINGKLYYLEENSWGENWNGSMKGYCWLSADFPFNEAYAIVENDIVPSLTPSTITTNLSTTTPIIGEKISFQSIATYNYPNITTNNIVTRDISNYPDLTITTSNPDLISIDKSKNTINALKAGKASIIFTYKGSGQEFIIDISEKPIPPDPPIPPEPPTPNQKIKNLTITTTSNTNKIFTNSSLQLQVIADKNSKTELDITDKVEWRLSDSSIATIDSSGNLSAIKEGKIKIIATYQYQYNNKSYTKSDYINIYVIPKTQYYTVNVLSTKDKMIADNMVEELNNKDLGFDAFIMQSGKYFKVYVGKFADNGSDEIKGLYKSLKGLGYKSSKIVYVSGR